ncbi:MAG: MMPL family transporter, partial [Clostridiales bacterium]|nr:MMPL family transporter [Clostridiales bacterium]
YKMADYLPESAQSTTALRLMKDEFGGAMPNTNVMIRDVTIRQAMEWKQRLEAVNGVAEVMWLDDVVDIKEPLEMADTDSVETFYKNGCALFNVTMEDGKEIETYDAIRELVGEESAIAGEAPDIAAVQRAASNEVSSALTVLLPVIVIILILATTSWVEPLLYMAAIGISIVFNMGTNIIFGEVSFLTNSVSPILQLAVSLDYAIFLLHSFADHRQKTGDVAEAMRGAVKDSFSAIAASAATTLFGFMALVFMNFGIGANLGLVLAKGIILSFVSVMVFLPALTLLVFKLIDKTKHRPFLPGFRGVGRTLSRLTAPALILVALVAIPCFLGQGHTGFLYGGGSVSENDTVGFDKANINERFGQSNVMVLMAPRGDIAKEQMLCESLEKIGPVTSVISYANQVGAAIPKEFLGDSITGRFYSENYTRFIIYADTPEEGDLAFGTVEEITESAKAVYGDDVWSAGRSANLYDMKNIVRKDNVMVNLIAIIAIFFVLLVTFKSVILPFILVFTIEVAIWINLSIPYFTGIHINFVGYLVLCTVQLGATVDYAILLTTKYMKHRKLLPQKEAMNEALGTAFRSIMVSAATLSTSGFILYTTSINPVVADIGLLLCRGALLSFAMVVCFLPGMLKLFDRAIAKTTRRAGFFFPDEPKAGSGRYLE